MNVKVFTLLLFVVQVQLAVAQWEVEFPESTRNSYYFIANPPDTDWFYTFGNDMAAFNTETNELTTNEDYTLELRMKNEVTSFPSPAVYNDVYFVNRDTGFIVKRSKIRKTTDRGQTWTTVLELLPNTQYISSAYFTDVFFPSDSIGYAVGTGEKIFKTTDGGDNWTELQWSDSTIPYRRLSEVVFRNDLEGYIIGYEVDDILQNLGLYRNYLLKTTDGGQSWTETMINPFPHDSDHHYGNLKLVGNDLLYLTLINRNYVFPFDALYRSWDDGATWEQMDLPTTYGLLIRDMHWFDSKKGILLASPDGFGEERTIYKTYNGGLDWERIELPIWAYPSFDQTFPMKMDFKKNEGIIVGSAGSVLHTEDEGSTWENKVFGRPNFQSIKVLDDANAYAVGSAGLILKKEGTNWDTLSPIGSSVGHVDDYKKVDFKDVQNGAIRSLIGDVYQTADGGANWDRIFNWGDTLALDIGYSGDQLLVLAKVDENKLMLFKQLANGVDWETILIDSPINSSSQWGRLQIISNELMYVSLENELFKSIDGGNVWDVLNTQDIDGFLNKFHFLDENTGWVALGEQIWMTVDGGITWEPSVLSEEINNIEFYQINGFAPLDEQRILAFVRIHAYEEFYGKNACFYSNDGGLSWTLFPLPINQESRVFGIEINAWDLWNQELYVGATNGVILKYSELVSALESPFLFEANIRLYPNPTTAECFIQHPYEAVDIEVYNLKGQLLSSQQNLAPNTSLSLAEWEESLFFVKVLYQNTERTFKVLKTE